MRSLKTCFQTHIPWSAYVHCLIYRSYHKKSLNHLNLCKCFKFGASTAALDKVLLPFGRMSEITGSSVPACLMGKTPCNPPTGMEEELKKRFHISNVYQYLCFSPTRYCWSYFQLPCWYLWWRCFLRLRSTLGYGYRCPAHIPTLSICKQKYLRHSQLGQIQKTHWPVKITKFMQLSKMQYNYRMIW